MADLSSATVWLTALMIFCLRVADMSLDTIRVLFVVRGRKALAWVLGFFQSAIFVVAISSVLSGKQTWLSILAYAAGFATGNVVGMLIEERLAIGHIRLNIISSLRGAEISDHLRQAGFAVTEIPARGKDGTVSVLQCSVLRRDFDKAETVIFETDREAFITAEEVRAVRRGFWRA